MPSPNKFEIDRCDNLDIMETGKKGRKKKCKHKITVKIRKRKNAKVEFFILSVFFHCFSRWFRSFIFLANSANSTFTGSILSLTFLHIILELASPSAAESESPVSAPDPAAAASAPAAVSEPAAAASDPAAGALEPPVIDFVAT